MEGTAPSKPQPLSAARRSTKQLSELMLTLGLAQRHFVQCIRPNALQMPSFFDCRVVLQQLRRTGEREAALALQAPREPRAESREHPRVAEVQERLRHYTLIAPALVERPRLGLGLGVRVRVRV